MISGKRSVKPRITLEEQERILLVAQGLLSEEESWTQGRWKCATYEYDANGRPVRKPDGEYAQKCDANGQPLYEYCVEGAINQAVYNVLGPERAERLGACRLSQVNDPESENFGMDGNGHVRYTPCELLGIDKIAMDMYGMPAMEYNDSEEGTHMGVVGLLTTRLSAVRRRLGRNKVAA